VAPVGYAELLEQVKVRVRTSRVQAARAVNIELVGLYWQIGRLILDRQESEGWGSKVIGRLAAVEAPIAQQAAAQLPWEFERIYVVTGVALITASPVRQPGRGGPSMPLSLC